MQTENTANATQERTPMTATLKDFNAIADQLRAAVRPDIKVSLKTTMFNPFDGTPARSHYQVTADLGNEATGHTLTDWYPTEDGPDKVIADALRMIRHLRPAPAAGETIEYNDQEILVQFIDVTPQGNWRVQGRYVEGEDFEKLADVIVKPFDWDEA